MAFERIRQFGTSLADLFAPGRDAASRGLVVVESNGKLTRSDTGAKLTKERISAQDALANATVSNSLQLVASGLAQVPFSASTDLVDMLLKNPNPDQTQEQFIYAIVWDMLLFGDAFYQIVRGENQQPQRLIPHDPEKVKIKVNDMNRPIYEIQGFTDALPETEMIHFRDRPTHGLRGEGRVQGCADLIKALSECNRLITKEFKNGFNIPMLFEEVAGARADFDKKEFYKDLADNYEGLLKGESALIIPNGLKRIEPQRMKPSDMDLRELRKHLIEEIAAHFAVPPFKVGGSANTKYANYSSALAALYRDTYAPLLRSIKQRLEKALSTNRTPVTVQIDESAILTGDIATAFGVAGQGNSFLTINEQRELCGYKRIEEGDPRYEERYDQISKAPAPAPQPLDRSDETPTDDGDMSDLPDDDRDDRDL